MIDSIWVVLLSIGVPSAIVGVMVHRVEKKLDKQEKIREQKENARQNHEVIMIELTVSALSLAQSTAEAVQRIPDAGCNGEMQVSLNKAKESLEKYREFERTQTIRAIS